MAKFKVSTSQDGKAVQFLILRASEDGIPDVVCNHTFTPDAARALGKKLYSAGKSLAEIPNEPIEDDIAADALDNLREEDLEEGI